MKSSKKIVIIANERVGYLTAQRVLELGFNVAAVFTSDPSRRSRIADYIDFAPLATAHPTVPVHFIVNPKESLVIQKIRDYTPDLILVSSWSQILPQELLEIAPLGTIGVHYSTLPERRGGAPLAWALIDGLDELGLSLFYYDIGVDTGDVIAQSSVPISAEDDAKSMLDKLVRAVPDLFLAHLGAILSGSAPRMKQDDSKATHTKARSPADGEIDWSLSPREIYNFIRAQATPYPCAFTKIVDKNNRTKKLVIPKARLDGDRLSIEGYVTDL